MIKLDEVQKLFPEAYVKVLGKKSGNFLLKLRSIPVFLPEKECQRYLDLKGEIERVSETCLFTPGYFEQAVEIPSRELFAKSRLFRMGNGEIKMKSSDGLSNIVLSGLSYLFILKFFTEKAFQSRIRGFFFRPSVGKPLKKSEESTLADAFSGFSSVKVKVPEKHRFHDDKGHLRSLAESALFHISSGTGISLILSNSWQHPYYRLSRKRIDKFRFPLRIYDSNLVSYYQMALSSDSPILSYLALYRILESLFLSTTEHDLHSRLSELLISQEFSHKESKSLRELTLLVSRFNRRMDEQKMLKMTLEHFFKPDEIIDWVKKYEHANGKYYTAAQTIFGITYVLEDTNPKQVCSSLAKRIYNIRNVLVHSKEIDMPQFIPFSGEEKFITKELPLLLFLAEKLIIKTGRDI